MSEPNTYYSPRPLPELLPCPCGGEAKLLSEYGWLLRNNGDLIYIRCSGFNCSRSISSDDLLGYDSPHSEFEKVDAVIDAWNTR